MKATFVIPAQAGIQRWRNVPGTRNWVPAYAGTTGKHLLYHRGGRCQKFPVPPVEEQTPSLRTPTIEAESELIKIVGQMLLADSALVSTEQPSVKTHARDGRQRLWPMERRNWLRRQLVRGHAKRPRTRTKPAANTLSHVVALHGGGLCLIP